MSSRLLAITTHDKAARNTPAASTPRPLPGHGVAPAPRRSAATSRRAPRHLGGQREYHQPAAPQVRSGSDQRTPHPLPATQQCVTPHQRAGSDPVNRLATRAPSGPRCAPGTRRPVIALPTTVERLGDLRTMAGTRRGPERTPRPTRAELRPKDRQRLLAHRLNTARNDRDRVAWAAANLRAVMADPTVTDELARAAADQAVKFLIALADQLQDHGRGKK